MCLCDLRVVVGGEIRVRRVSGPHPPGGGNPNLSGEEGGDLGPGELGHEIKLSQDGKL